MRMNKLQVLRFVWCNYLHHPGASTCYPHAAGGEGLVSVDLGSLLISWEGGDLGSERTESVTAYFLKYIKSVAFFFSEMHLLFSFYLITFNSVFFKKYILR